MRIAPPILSGGNAIRRTGRAPSPAGPFASAQAEMAQDVPAATGTSAPVALTALGTLLLAQEIDGAEQRRRRGMQRGRRVLAELEELRMALLDGALPVDQLTDLRRMVAEEQAGGVDDPALALVLKEIDLRAAVELAKIERALEDQAARAIVRTGQPD